MGRGFLNSNGTHYKYFYWEILPLVALAHYLDIHQITAARQISAAVVNISGRQRMLCQRSALFCLQLIFAQTQEARDNLRCQLREIIILMEKSHEGLIHGDSTLNLSEKMSPTVKKMYFEAPINLDNKVRLYIAEVQFLLEDKDDKLTSENDHLIYILNSSSSDLLAAFDAVVTQYQKESDIEQLAIDIHLLELYQQSITAQQAEQEKAQKLENTLRELQKAQAQLIHAEKMSSLGQLVAGVAHEINNPVSFISGNLHYARDYVNSLLSLLQLYHQEYPHANPQIQEHAKDIELDFLLEDLPKVLSSMQVGAERICHLVRSLRNFSRTDQEDMKCVDIHEGIESTLLILQNRLKARGKYPTVEVIKEYSNLPLVECYAGQINQVLMNIISNAIDAMEEVNLENPEIRIATKILEDNRIAIYIADNGPGVPENVAKHIFDPFFTTKEVGKGTGLGLSISYQIIVENHGGLLLCTPILTGGTQFSIEIPMGQNPQPSFVKNCNNDDVVSSMANCI
jgi:two-component system, NtrC family, sensor kinase